MPIYLISGGTKEKRDQEIKKIYGMVKPEGNIEKDPDFQFVGKDEDLNVETIRGLESALSLKPYLSSPKVFVIEPFDSLTFEAQNILANILEKLGESVIIISGNNEDILNEQILNKGQKISLPKEMENVATKEEEQEAEKILKEILKADVGKRLKLISMITSREEAERFCQLQLIIWRKRLLENGDKKILLNIAAIQKTLHYLKANVNYKLAIENLILYFH